MEYSELHIAILRKMFFDTRIGGRHIGEKDLSRGFPSHVKGDIPEVLDDLNKARLVNKHPTRYGMQYSLNSAAIDTIKDIIE